MTDVIQVITTTASEGDARHLARLLLEARLAACVQCSGPIQSSYWWEGRIEQATEWVCAIKTRRQLYPQVEQAIRASHTYQEPEILAVPVLEGSAGYLAWVAAQVRPVE